MNTTDISHIGLYKFTILGSAIVDNQSLENSLRLTITIIGQNGVKNTPPYFEYPP